MNIVFMGTPEFGCLALEELNKKYNVVLVISQPNREKKHGKLIDTPIASKAKELNLSLIQVEDINKEEDLIKSYNPDVLITAAFGQYIKSNILNIFKYKINIHASLLPLHRGGAPIQRCLINGDTKTGVTIMEMSKGLDKGKIYAVKEYQILDDDNSTTLFEKLAVIGKDLLMESIDDIISGKNQGVKQDDSLATFSKNIEPEEEKIDLNKNTKDIINLIRGLALKPGAYLVVKDIKLKIYKASYVEDNSNSKPGTVLKVKKGVVLKTLDGAISLDLVQLPGKNMVNGVDFSNGQKIFNLGEVI